ncbi:MAG TPA: phosphatase PAP2 family protein [Candidatus Methylacidiphilales bacterium]|nr:phosphatase PAP2 family protein [Candidatus Methylacidiphilales bacterium]
MTLFFAPFYRFVLFFALLAPSTLIWAKETAPVHYVGPSEINFVKTLPPVVPVGELQAKFERDFELSLVIEVQEKASSADVQRARDEANTPDHLPSPYSFSDVIGPWFKADNAKISRVAVLMKNVIDDAEVIVQQAKKHWNRTRPFRQDPADVKLQTDNPSEVPSPTSASYPSGHGTDGMLFALILSDLAPQLHDKLMARGIEYGNDRVILGVHFPSDVAAGRALGGAIYAALQGKKAYRDDLAAAKAQFQKELATHGGL